MFGPRQAPPPPDLTVFMVKQALRGVAILREGRSTYEISNGQYHMVITEGPAGDYLQVTCATSDLLRRFLAGIRERGIIVLPMGGLSIKLL